MYMFYVKFHIFTHLYIMLLILFVLYPIKVLLYN